jgi:hypothetical protein
MIGEMAKLLSQADGLDDSNTGSASAFVMAGSWLRTCFTQHVKCNQYQKGPSILPSRVINVGPPDGSQEPFLYSNGGRHDYYLTLSHRWGDYEAIRTTQGNLEGRSRLISMDALPKTFRHAMIITRKLGLRYLWIDTLCIVQDDPSDWKREASNMAHIFSNSLLTIAAAADNCYDHGIFRKRARQRNRPCALDLRLSHRQRALFQKPGQLFAFGNRHKSGDVARPPGELDKRAWILQEQLLSPRVLYYTSGELFWDCVSIKASESYPTGIPDLLYNTDHSGQSFRGFNEAVRSNILNSKSVSVSELFKTWRQVAHVYSERKVTVQTDRIIAMAGIVTQIEKGLNDQCIFGLWAKHLNSEQMWQELLWWVEPKEHEQRRVPITRDRKHNEQDGVLSRPVELQVPTWSWYSVLGPISYEKVDSRDHNAVTCEARFEGIDEKSFHPFTAMLLHGRMTRMYSRNDRGSRKISPIHEGAIRGQMRAIEYANRKRTGSVNVASDPTTEWAADIFGVHASTHPLWCLEIARANIYQMCLCLTPLDTTRRPKHLEHWYIFERIGICSWNMFENGELPYGSSLVYIV